MRVRLARIVEARDASVPVVVTAARGHRADRPVGARRHRARRDHERRRRGAAPALARQVGRVDPVRLPACRCAPHGHLGAAARSRSSATPPGRRASGAEPAAARRAARARASARSRSWRGCWPRECDLVVFADAAAARARRSAPRSRPASRCSRAPDTRLADLDGAILQTADIAAGTMRALGDADLRRELAARAREYCHDHSWDRVAQRHVALWAALEAT